MKQKFRNYGFIMGVVVAIIGALVAIGNVFNFKVDEIAITSIITAILGVFVALGLVEKDEDKTSDTDQNTLENTEETKQNTQIKDVKENNDENETNLDEN